VFILCRQVRENGHGRCCGRCRPGRVDVRSNYLVMLVPNGPKNKSMHANDGGGREEDTESNFRSSFLHAINRVDKRPLEQRSPPKTKPALLPLVPSIESPML